MAFCAQVYILVCLWWTDTIPKVQNKLTVSSEKRLSNVGLSWSQQLLCDKQRNRAKMVKHSAFIPSSMNHVLSHQKTFWKWSPGTSWLFSVCKCTITVGCCLHTYTFIIIFLLSFFWEWLFFLLILSIAWAMLACSYAPIKSNHNYIICLNLHRCDQAPLFAI